MLVTAAILTCLMLFLSLKSTASTNISGIINTYTAVSGITNCTCPTVNCATATVASAAGFSVGDRVLIFQMKGARVDSSNTAAHGSVLNLYDAGNYEEATISGIAGNVVTTAYPLINTYFTSVGTLDSAYVQMIRIPVYSGDVNITGTLTPQAWNPATRTGGVLVFETNGNVTLNANITADGYGFKAARYLKATLGCSLDTNFYYQSTIWQHTACTSCGYVYDDSPTRYADNAAFGGCSAPCQTNRMMTVDSKEAGFRGEGISANTFKKTFANGNVAYFDMGKGRWANGGGGGGNHNAGGGGGGNYGAGGWGGNSFNVVGGGSGCTAGTLTVRRGYGGASLTPTATKIYMGGGGGEGHDDGGQGTTGTNGGGIIMITAVNITNGGAYTISANGVDQTTVALGDGAGGGGAGGSILMNVSGVFTNAVTISAKGGKGGDHNNNTCHGTGGGGGGGVVWFSAGSLPANVTTNVAGGANGTQVAPTIDCGDVNWGATAGATGTNKYGNAAGATAFINSNSCSSPLPVSLVSFTASVNKDKVLLDWTTASEINNNYFIVEKSADGNSFTEMDKIKGAGNSATTRHYHLTDYNPDPGISYYRLKQTDYDGAITYSKWVDVNVQLKYDISVGPNPIKGRAIKINLPEKPTTSCRVYINDLTGKKVYDRIVPSELFDNTIVISDAHIAATGLYYLIVELDQSSYSKKMNVEFE
jgi:hypothetical protein